MTPEFTKVEIKLYVSANDQDVATLNKNIKTVQQLIQLAVLAGALDDVDSHLRMPAALFAMADIEVVRNEPTNKPRPNEKNHER